MKRSSRPYQFEDKQLQAAVTAERELRAAIDSMRDQPDKVIMSNPAVEELGRSALLAWDDALGPPDEPLELEQFLLVSIRSAQNPDYERHLLEPLASVI